MTRDNLGYNRKQDNSGQGKVQGAVDQAKQTASDVADQVQQAAAPVVDQAKQTTNQVVDQAKQQAQSQISTRKDQAANSIDSLASALRQTGKDLQEQDQGTVAGFVDQAASQLDRFSNYLQNRDINQIVGEVEDFARREPALFVGGAFLLGLIGARFLKSSPPQRPGAQNYNSPLLLPERAGQTYRSRMEGNRFDTEPRLYTQRNPNPITPPGSMSRMEE